MILEVHMAVAVVSLTVVPDMVVVVVDLLTSSVKFVLNMDTLSMFVILRLI